VGALLHGQRFVMIGDYYLLNPPVKSYDADKRGLGVSLFRRLCEKWPYEVAVLKKQHRMNNHICNLSNLIAYKSLIKHADKSIEEAILELPIQLDDKQTIPWVKEAKQPKRKVLFINVDNLLNKTLQKQLNAMKNKNYYEAAVISALLENLF